MGRQSRPFIVVVLVLIALIGILNALSQTILGGSYAALEEQSVRRDVSRALNALTSNLDELNSKASDWATWDAAYEFVQGESPEFGETEVTALALQHLNIDLMLFLQPDGNLVLGRAIDLAHGVEIPLAKGMEDFLADRNALNAILQNTNPDSGLTGIILLPENPLMVAARPIVTSEGKGPIRGTLIFGHYVDSSKAREMSTTTRLSLTFQRTDQPPLPDEFQIAASNLSDANPLFVRNVTEQVVNGYASIKDVFGKPAVILRVDETRDIYEQGQSAIHFFTLVSIAIGILFIGITHPLLNWLVRSRRELSESEARYRAVIEQAVEGIFLLDPQTQCVLGANAAFCKLLGYTPEEIPRLSVDDLLAPDDAGVAQNPQTALIEAHDLGERTYRRKDGSRLVTEASTSPISYGGRKVILGVVRDMTERKQAEAERARLFEQEQTRREELGTLYALSRALADAPDFDAILELVVRHAAETIHVTFARVLLIEDSNLVLRAGYPIRLLDRDLQIGRRERIGEFPFCQRLLTQDAPVVVRADTTEIDDYEHAMLFLYLARSLCLVPLRAGERVFGLLLLGEARQAERERFSPEKTRLARSVAEQAASALRRAELFGELERAYFQTVLALARAVDAKDTYTADHAEHLAEMALAIGRALGLTPHELEDLRYGAILHDIGKIGVPDAVLLKPAKLDEAEWKRMRQHPAVGAQILAPLPRLAGAAAIVRHHHERYDGAGYPDGLVGDAIPLGARILTVVDSYSAITDARVYKPARSRADAVAELEKNAGAQFDPRIVEVFLRLPENDRITEPA